MYSQFMMHGQKNIKLHILFQVAELTDLAADTCGLLSVHHCSYSSSCL